MPGEKGERPDAGERDCVGGGGEAHATASGAALLLPTQEQGQPAAEYIVGSAPGVGHGR